MIAGQAQRLPWATLSTFLGGSSSNSDLLRYDPTTDTWARLAPLQQSREHTQAVALNGYLYALGGRWQLGLNTVERYDPATDTWTRIPSMKQPRSGFGAAVWDGKNYCCWWGATLTFDNNRLNGTL